MTGSLFEATAYKPLAEQMRPTGLKDVIGQDHLLGKGAPLARMATDKRITSMILWGPPGIGKTTLGLIMAKAAGLEFERLSAVMDGLPKLRELTAAATSRRQSGKGTVLFLDEIHRWNKSQQDALLPYVEDGTIVLIGATTENPSFELNPALLSRCPVYVLNAFDDSAMAQLLKRAESHVGQSLPVTAEAREALRSMAQGDARYLLSLCEELFAWTGGTPLDVGDLASVLQKRMASYDQSGDSRYGLLSALQKSIRGSDVDASLYWLARMLVAGEDIKVLLRRLIVTAAEDIGMADPNALVQAVTAAEAFHRVGIKEGRIILAQMVSYLATAPKSNASYKAISKALDLAESTAHLPPPPHIVNAPTELMQSMGFKEGYEYDHDHPHAFSGQNFFPDGMNNDNRPMLYHPNERGFEREVSKRIEFWAKRRADLKRQKL